MAKPNKKGRAAVGVLTHTREDAQDGSHRNSAELERLVRERTQELEQANAALQQSQRSLAAELEAAQRLQQVSTKLIQADRVEELYELILDTALATMHADFASLQKLYPKRGSAGELYLLGHRGFTPEAARLWEWVRPGTQTSCGVALRTRQRVVVPDAERCEFMTGSDDLEAYLKMGIRAAQTTPLLSRSGALLGVFSTHWRQPHDLTAVELWSLDVLARQAADIIEKKQAEEAIRASEEQLRQGKAGLERKVAERTTKLRELVGELEHFSYTITHDLKSPLRAMKGYAEITATMCGDSARKEVKEALSRISISAERMECLITDALNYSRAVRQELPLTNVDTGALLNGMLQSYPDLQPSKVNIRVEGKLPTVQGNEAGLTQCFSNLLVNAVKFVKPGEKPLIRVWAEERGDWARIWVEDNGIGISKEMLPRVFDMFSRGSTSHEGTGIGLALVRKVTQRMGGRTGVESEEGKGSRFWLEVKSPKGRTGAAAGPNGATVLYVEDDEVDTMFMKMAFARQGMESALQVVGDGRKALEYLSGADEHADQNTYPIPSVVLLDLILPQVPGYDVLRWIRTHPDFARTPVIVFSSSMREDDRVRSLELGADEFVPKPSSGTKFDEVVNGLKKRWMGAVQG
jgi:signal transduction histidine kinase/CheY-like chemotaxis protein